MKRKRLLWQLYPLYIIIIIVPLLSVTWYATRTLKLFYVNSISRELESKARLVSKQITPLPDTEDDPELNKFITELGNESSTRITVILDSGKVLCDSEKNPGAMDNHGNRPEIKKAYEGRVGVAQRFSYTLDKNMLYVAVPLEPNGVIRMSVPVTGIDEALNSIYLEIFLGGLAIAVFSALVSLFAARRIARPLEEMRLGAERFAKGDLGFRLTPSETHSVEISGLVETMNMMAERLDERIRTTVRQHNEKEAILTSMVEGVLTVDQDEKIIDMNRTAAEMLGVMADKVRGRAIQEVVRNAELQRFITRALNTTEAIEDEIALGGVRKRMVQAHGNVFKGMDDASRGILIVLNDVTRILKLEKLRRDFVANVSHELKTPITTIKGFVETLLDGASKDNEKAEHFLGIVARHTDRLNAIITDLLTLSKLEQESEESEFAREKIPARSMLVEAVRICEDKWRKKSIDVEVDCPNDVTTVVNSQLIVQAVVNLLDNAIKYSDNRTMVIIRGFKTEEDVTVIEVQDQGFGIGDKHLPRLFERFYRVDKARSRQQGGTGLGLAIVKHIAQAHGGSVSVESEPGEGSVFSIHLPD